MQIKKQNFIKSKLLTLYKISFVFLFILLLGKNVQAVPLIENFDSYTANIVLSGQGGWSTTGTSDIVSNTKFESSPNSYRSYRNGTTKIVTKTIATTTDSIVNFEFDFLNDDVQTGTNNPVFLYELLTNNSIILYSGTYPVSANTFEFRVGNSNLNTGAQNCGTFNENVWYHANVEINFTTKTMRCNVNGGSYSSTYSINASATGIKEIKIESNTIQPGASYIDNIGSADAYSHYIATTPVSTSTPSTLPVTINTEYYVGEDIASTTIQYAKWVVTNKDTGANLILQGSQLELENTGVKNISYSLNSLPNGFYTVYSDFGFSVLPLNSPIGQTGYFLIGTTTLNTTQIANITNNVNTAIPYQNNNYRECGIGDLSGCIYNAFIYLFYPNQSITEQFKNLDIENRAPFIYAYEINTLRQEMFNASDTGITNIGVTIDGFGTITFLSKDMIDSVPYSSTIKDLLTWIIYILMAEFIYLKVKNMHN